MSEEAVRLKAKFDAMSDREKRAFCARALIFMAEVEDHYHPSPWTRFVEWLKDVWFRWRAKP